jgi:hypothetical protein
MDTKPAPAQGCQEMSRAGCHETSRIKNFFVAVALAFTAMGCGVESPEAASETLESREDSARFCFPSDSWEVEYYSDSTKTVQIGGECCACDGVLKTVGTTSVYSTFAFFYCRY